MQRLVLIVLVLLSVGSHPVRAQNNRTPTAYGKLHTKWKAFVRLATEVTPPLSVAEQREKKHAINVKFTKEFLKLAQAHSDDDLWLDCLIWTTVEGVPGEEFDAMFDLLRENANGLQDTFQLQLLMSEFVPLTSERIDPALSSIVETHPSDGVRGAALFVLASRTKRRAEYDGDEKGCAQAEILLQRVIDEFPDVHTYRGENRENATGLLEELNSDVAISKVVPNIIGTTLSGGELDLSHVAKGKVAVISFSGHWCGPCVRMHSVQKKLLEKYSDDQLVIVEINSDKPESLDNVRQKIEADGLNWLVVPDRENRAIAEQWHVTAWPTFYVVDTDGRIRHRAVGHIGDQLIHWVDALASKGE